MEQVDSTKVIAYGDSLFVRVPKSLCKIMGIQKGTELKIFRDGEKIVYEHADET